MSTRPSTAVSAGRDQLWDVIGEERLRLADLLGGLDPGDWGQPSLCAGWTVRDVAAHLTLQQLGPGSAVRMMAAYRGDTDRAIRETARQRAAAWTTDRIAADIRDTAWTRRHNFGVTAQETLIDLLVHGQDIVVPLGRAHRVPPAAAAVAASRVWTMRWPPPFPARRVLARFRVTATDIAWSAGQGPVVRAPIAAILLMSAGRQAGLAQASGPGAAELRARLTGAA